MAYYYLKLYHDILDDPKMGRLSDHLFRRVIELFLIASDTNERDGYLPRVEDMAWRLRADTADLQSDLENIESQTGIIKLTERGWHVTNFAKRQDAVSGAERTQRYRDRNVKEMFASQPSNEPVTKRHTDIDIELNIDIDKEGELNHHDSEVAAIFRRYEAEIGPLTKSISDRIGDAIDTYPHNWIIQAIDEAALHNARSWSYAAACLKNWKADGFKAKKQGGNGKSTISEPASYPALRADWEKRNGVGTFPPDLERQGITISEDIIDITEVTK